MPLPRLLLLDFETAVPSGDLLQRIVCCTFCWQGERPFVLLRDEALDFLEGQLRALWATR